jgi:hypothetical protein
MCTFPLIFYYLYLDTLKKLTLTNYNYYILFYLSLSIPYKQIEVVYVCMDWLFRGLMDWLGCRNLISL